MAYLADRFFGWIDYEPLIGLLMVVATIALFLGAWRRAGVAVLFLGMLWAFRAILNLGRSVTTAGMGIALPKPEQPGEKVLLVLERSPYSLMLLVVSVCLTLLVLGRRVDFLETSLLSAVYCVLFFVMAATSDYLLGFWGSLIPGAALTVGLAAILLRREERRVRVPSLALVLFFTAVYPVVGLVPDFEQPFDAMVSIGLVVYLFFLVFSTRPSGELQDDVGLVVCEQRRAKGD